MAAERRAAVEWVGAQRTLAIEFVTAQRLAFMEAIDVKVGAAVGTVQNDLAKALNVVREERIAAMQDVDGTAIRTVDTAMRGLRDLVDYTLVRLAVLLLVLMVSATALGVLGYRLTAGRRTAAA